MTYWQEGQVSRVARVPGNTARSMRVTGLPSGSQWTYFLEARYCAELPVRGCSISGPSERRTVTVR
jgi:hypothetical protein